MVASQEEDSLGPQRCAGSSPASCSDSFLDYSSTAKLGRLSKLLLVTSFKAVPFDRCGGDLFHIHSFQMSFVIQELSPECLGKAGLCILSLHQSCFPLIFRTLATCIAPRYVWGMHSYSFIWRVRSDPRELRT